MKERLNLSVAATTSNEDILALRGELQNFVTADENRRDFQPEVEIELRSVGDLKQLDLRVEIRHKSNFSNETVRNHRRNKFMTELLSAARRIPLEPPGGAGAPLGDPSNPAYSVAISDFEGIAARDRKAREVAEGRLFPVGWKYGQQEGGSSGLSPSLKGSFLGRRGDAVTGRRSGESIVRASLERRL